MAISESGTDLDVNGVSLSVIQPDSVYSPLTASSYLRLGSYTPTGPDGRSENELITHVSVTASQIPDDHGILLYTNHDLQQNVLGAGRMKYGRGHAIKVLEGNACLDVDDGRYDLSAKQGVAITAGDASTSADIVIMAQGHVRIISNGNTSQVANGNVDQSTTGNNDQTTVGDWKQTVIGIRSEITAGEKLDLCLGSKTNVSFPLVTNAAIGMRLDLVAGCHIALSIGVDATYTSGFRNEFVKKRYLLDVSGTATIKANVELAISAPIVNMTANTRLNIQSIEYTLYGRNVTQVVDGSFNQRLGELGQIAQVSRRASNASILSANVRSSHASIAEERVDVSVVRSSHTHISAHNHSFG